MMDCQEAIKHVSECQEEICSKIWQGYMKSTDLEKGTIWFSSLTNYKEVEEMLNCQEATKHISECQERICSKIWQGYIKSTEKNKQKTDLLVDEEGFLPFNC